jgi:hypothetical protein
MKTIFLGGTCNNSKWRDELIPKLNIDYFNPVVKEWTPEAQQEELKQRQECDYVLYVITPDSRGIYSIAEAVDDSNKRPQKTIFMVLLKDGVWEFTDAQLNSIGMVEQMILKNGATVLHSLQEVADFVNIETGEPVLS